MLSQEDVEYVQQKNQEGWTPDVIIGRKERDLGISVRTLYRRYQDTSELNIHDLPMKGQRKSNNHQEKRGKQAFKRGIKEMNYFQIFRRNLVTSKEIQLLEKNIRAVLLL